MCKIKTTLNWINGRFDITEENISAFEGLVIDNPK